jgi:transcriptional regulator with XRE-family HTH domain
MALPDYFRRSAVAAAQVLQGFDEDAIRERLEAVTVGLALGEDALTPEGDVLAEVSVRLLARLYPRLAIDEGQDKLADLALAINPEIELTEQDAEITLAIGNAPTEGPAIFAGCEGWEAQISNKSPRPIGQTTNPFGPSAAACLAAANLFRLVFLERGKDTLDSDLTFSTLDLQSRASASPPSTDAVQLGDGNVIVGLGAVGSAAAFTLSRLEDATGTLSLVDPETIELSNLQRYVLTERNDDQRPKTALAAAEFAKQHSGLAIVEHAVDWATYANRCGYKWERVLVALDSARARRAVQASLPRWIANAWTQPGDLGVSVHPWNAGACLCCLYLPTGTTHSEDKLIAEALGIARPERELQIRQLLYANAPPPLELLQEVAERLDVPLDVVEPFQDRPLRELYSEGICGGAVLPLDRVNAPHQQVHVPLAHQSVLAGVLLASRLVAHSLGSAQEQTTVTRLDLLAPITEFVTQPAQKDPRGICICQDPIYNEAYALKYPAIEK